MSVLFNFNSNLKCYTLPDNKHYSEKGIPYHTSLTDLLDKVSSYFKYFANYNINSKSKLRTVQSIERSAN